MSAPRHAAFLSTRWSLIRRLDRRDPERRAALEELCARYWAPVRA